MTYRRYEPFNRTELDNDKPPADTRFDHAAKWALSCFRCGHRNLPKDREPYTRAGKGQTRCLERDACKMRM